MYEMIYFKDKYFDFYYFFGVIIRILANRKSAQRSRVRKLQYISELERSVTTLQVRSTRHNNSAIC